MLVNGNSLKLGLYFKASPKDIVIYSGLTAISFITLSDARKSYDLSVQCASDSYLIFVNGQQQTVVNNFHSTIINGSIAMPIVYRIAYSVSFPIVVGRFIGITVRLKTYWKQAIVKLQGMAEHRFSIVINYQSFTLLWYI